MTRPSLFGSSRSTTMFGSVSSGNASEVDLRQEFDDLIFGADGSTRKGYPLVIRHMRRDADGNKIDCVCLNELTKSPDPDCSYCYGEGYYWDESWYIGRSQFISSAGGRANKYRFTPAGEIRSDTKIFFFRYDVPLLYGDKIIEMKLDTEGDPVVPYKRTAIYDPHTVDYLRSDNGRVEFITAYCLEDDAIRSDTL